MVEAELWKRTEDVAVAVVEAVVEAEEGLWKRTEDVAVEAVEEEEVDSISAAEDQLCSPWNRRMKKTVEAVV